MKKIVLLAAIMIACPAYGSQLELEQPPQTAVVLLSGTDELIHCLKTSDYTASRKNELFVRACADDIYNVKVAGQSFENDSGLYKAIRDLESSFNSLGPENQFNYEMNIKILEKEEIKLALKALTDSWVAVKEEEIRRKVVEIIHGWAYEHQCEFNKQDPVEYVKKALFNHVYLDVLSLQHDSLRDLQRLQKKNF